MTSRGQSGVWLGDRVMPGAWPLSNAPYACPVTPERVRFPALGGVTRLLRYGWSRSG